jgi:predicted metal-dependent hydrolase
MKNRYIYEDLEIIHIKRKRLKNIYISVNKAQEVFVKTNISTSKTQVIDIVNQKYNWIKKHLEKFDNIDSDIARKEAIYFMGNKYKIVQNNVPTPVVVAMLQKIYVPIGMEYEEILKTFYKSNTMILDKLVDKCVKVANLIPSKVTYRYMKSRWGSCGAKNQISLNTQLLKFPDELIEYVVYHELAHIVHKNHSKDFWSVVEKFVPNYKECRQKLREY